MMEKIFFALDGEYRRVLGYLPQEFGFYPEFSVHDYLIVYCVKLKECEQVLHESV